MKLKDLVANSLPRVRGRKKKAAASAGTPTATTEAAAKSEPSTACSGSDKNQNRFPSIGARSSSRDDSLDLQGITEASWRGNALYRGLEAARAVKFNSRMMSNSYTSAHGMVTSHSAEGFSSQLMMMSRSYDSRMNVPNCNESCPQMSSITETCKEPFSTPQQYYHCHYHRHNHHHYHHHHLHPKPMAPLEQNQQRLYPDACHAELLASHKVQEETKAEPGFFRKSFAAFGGIRKQINKTNKDAKQNESEKMVCSVCPYPGTASISMDKQSTDKRAIKPKRKGLKACSKLKENKEKVLSPEKCEKSWFSDNDTHRVTPLFSTVAMMDPNFSVLSSIERSRVRERSVESCSSRLYGSREGSAVRELDFTGFDSASLSGYESDLPRSKVHRSRSRIKTNPWLPSPQMSGGTRSEHCELRESTEDIQAVEDSRARFPRSASFECQRSGKMPIQTSQKTESDKGTSGSQRPRSLTPSDNKIVLSLNPDIKSSKDDLKPSWWSVNLKCENLFDVKDTVNLKVVTPLNDLNNDVPKSRPNSMVSPNSEFVMLADNLEQLANNISFEYEEMLDTTLESVSIFPEDGQASIQELLTDEENGNTTKACQKSDGDIHSAHSPDSGIGGLGSTDGDDTLTPTAQMDQKGMSVENLQFPSTQAVYGVAHGNDHNFDLPISRKFKSSEMKTSANDSQHLPPDACGSSRSFALLNSRDSDPPRHKIIDDDGNCHKVETCGSAAFSESDIDNTSYQGISSMPYHGVANLSYKGNSNTSHQGMSSMAYQGNANLSYKSSSNTLCQGRGITTFKENVTCASKAICAAKERNLCHNEKLGFLSSASEAEPDKGSKNATLMVNERLDIEFQPCHRQFHGSGIVMGTGRAMHDHGFGVPMKQMSGKISDVSGTTSRRNQRPCAFKGSHSTQELPRRMNDIERSFNQVQQRGSCSSDFDFPRNISITECVESPTENWQCDEQFCMSACPDTATPNQQIGGVQGAGKTLINECKFDNDSGCIENVQLIVKLDDVITKQAYQTRNKVAHETVSHMDCSLDNCASGSHTVSFELSDASVQTDFDDDFSRWDEADPLESLEDKALDPAESTRLWLLTGNMQGSADTGYSSLTRDSQIIMDEDSLFLAGELEERAAAERLSYGESSSNIHTPPPAQFKIHSCDVSSCPERHALQQKDISNTLLKTEQGQCPQDDRIMHNFQEKEYPFTNLSSKSFSSHDKTSRSIPHGTINQIFSNIESQFLEIYQQISHDKSTFSSTAQKSTSSDSSDQTIKSSYSNDLECDALHKHSEEYTKTKDSETGETKVCLRSKSDKGLYTDIDYVDILSPDPLDAAVTHSRPKGHNHVKGRHNQAYDKESLGHVGSKPQPRLQVPGQNHTSQTKHCQENAAPVRMLPHSERADYLEFLKDAPLSRSHLKRPLFLVPGLGPVDMSCPEQINLFAETGTSVNQTRFPCSFVPSTSAAPSMSPSTAHCGKKLKYKKGDHTISTDHAHSSTDTAAALPFAQCSQVLPHRRPDKTAGNMSSNSNPKAGPSVFIPDGRYSIAKAPSPRQNGDSSCCTSSQNSQQPPSHSLQPLPAAAKAAAGGSRTSDSKKVKDDVTKSLREKVMSLRREKDVVFQKIQEARQDEKFRKEQRMQIQKNMHAQRKEALLETLHELKNKLEEQSKLLKQREGPSGDK